MLYRKLALCFNAAFLFSIGSYASAENYFVTGVNYSELDSTDYNYDLWMPLEVVMQESSYSLSVGTRWLLDSSLTPSSGMGDLTLSGSLYDVIFSDDWKMGVDLGASIKLPTAKEGVGSGELDAGVDLSVYRLTEYVTWHGVMSYLQKGDSSDINYSDVLSLTLGATTSISSALYLGGFFDINRDQTSQEVYTQGALYLSAQRESVTIRPYVIVAFNDDNSLDGAGLYLDFRL